MSSLSRTQVITHKRFANTVGLVESSYLFEESNVKTKNKFSDGSRDRTEEIRCALTFLQFIENKIINKQVFCISSMDIKEIDHFAEFMTLYMPK